MEVSITRMLAEHIPAVVELERQCRLSTRGEDGYARLLQDANSALLISQNTDSQVVGCFSGWLVADEFEIDNIAVAADYRQSGIGSKLLSAAIKIALQKGAIRAFLEVRSNNIAACCLYEKFGFNVAGRRKNYYRDPADDGLILSLEIVSQS